MSLDPKGFAAGDMDLYGYVGNGPTDAIDDSGEQGIPGMPEDPFTPPKTKPDRATGMPDINPKGNGLVGYPRQNNAQSTGGGRSASTPSAPVRPSLFRLEGLKQEMANTQAQMQETQEDIEFNQQMLDDVKAEYKQLKKANGLANELSQLRQQAIELQQERRTLRQQQTSAQQYLNDLNAWASRYRGYKGLKTPQQNVPMGRIRPSELINNGGGMGAGMSGVGGMGMM